MQIKKRNCKSYRRRKTCRRKTCRRRKMGGKQPPPMPQNLATVTQPWGPPFQVVDDENFDIVRQRISIHPDNRFQGRNYAVNRVASLSGLPTYVYQIIEMTPAMTGALEDIAST